MKILDEITGLEDIYQGFLKEKNYPLAFKVKETQIKLLMAYKKMNASQGKHAERENLSEKTYEELLSFLKD